MENNTVTLEQFESLVAEHDLTYAYADDFSSWKSGSYELQKIQEMAKQLPREDVVRIWNKYVDIKLVPNARSEFYW